MGTYKPFPENSLGTCHTLQNNVVRRRNGSSTNCLGLVNVGDITNRIQELNIHQLSPQVCSFMVMSGCCNFSIFFYSIYFWKFGFQVDIPSSISTFLDHEFPNLLKQIEDMQMANPSRPSLTASSSSLSPPPDPPASQSANSGAFSCLPVRFICVIHKLMSLLLENY